MAPKTQTSARVLLGLQKASERRGMEARQREAEKAGGLSRHRGVGEPWGSQSPEQHNLPAPRPRQREDDFASSRTEKPSFIAQLPPTVPFLTSWLLFSNAF